MHLINVKTMQLEDFLVKPPPYAILSHTWGGEELTYGELQAGNLRGGAGQGREKVVRCCRQAEEDGLAYAWVDTCCIDKTNSVELSEAINSMFRWYQEAAICYAYLADVPPADKSGDGLDPHPAFADSRWFQRGWTLQELLAPSELLFYDQTWEPIATKAQLASEVEAITGIPAPCFLDGVETLQQASVAQRMSWAAHRTTTREEDRSYCLLGLFGANMPMIYGEGGVNAFARLQQTILQRHRDTSLFAWGFGRPQTRSPIGMPLAATNDGIWASSPSDFSDCGRIVVRDDVPMTVFNLTVGRLQTNLSVCRLDGEVGSFLLLGCGVEGDMEHVVGMPVIQVDFVLGEYFRTWRHVPRLIHMSATRAPTATVLIHTEPGIQRHCGIIRQRRLSLRYARRHLTVVEAFPSSVWRGDCVVLPGRYGVPACYLVRFRPRGGGGDLDKDVIVRFKIHLKDQHDVSREGPNLSPDEIVTSCDVMTLSRGITMKDFYKDLQSFRPTASGQQAAAIGSFTIAATLQNNGSHGMSITLRRPPTPPVMTVDADLEIELAHQKSKYSELSLEYYMWQAALKHATQQAEKTPIAIGGACTSLAAIVQNIRELLEAREAGEKEQEFAELEMEMENAGKEFEGLAKAYFNIDERLRAITKKKGKLVRRIDQQGLTEGPGNWLETELSLVMQAVRINGDKMSKRSVQLIDRMVADFLAGGSGDVVVAGDDVESGSEDDAEGGSDDDIGEGWRDEIDTRMWDASFHDPLRWTAKNGHIAEVRLLLERGAAMDSVDYNRNITPLMLAAAEGHEDTARLLLARGATFEATDSYGLQAMDYAIRKGQTAVVQLLIDSGADVKGILGARQLRDCWEHGKRAIAQLLMAHGADESADMAKGCTPLEAAAMRGEEKVVARLLDEGAAANPENYQLALEAATSRGHAPVVRQLLDSGVAVDLPAGTRRRAATEALFYAIHSRQAAIARLLIEADEGAQINEKNGALGTPFDNAVMSGFEEGALLLVAKGADIPELLPNYWTPLRHAVAQGLYALARLLIDRGADMNEVLGYVTLPRSRKNKDMLQLLFDHGAAVT